jgi:glycosyltransferase involved in cell wall biosynthesis
VPPTISVMLPTYKRPEALERTLAALEKQSLEPDCYEIIVVDDGSADQTEMLVDEFARQTHIRFSYIVLKDNGGPARARNFGLAACRAGVVLIIGDDIEPDRCLVEKHLDSHRQHPEDSHALLGHVSFPEEMQPTGFMHWLATGGRKYFFNYQDLVPGQPAGPLYFYTCNVSVKMALLDKSGWFDESFPYASHEDLELGFRLAEQDMQMIYEPAALGYHWHMLSVQGIARRVYLMGYSALMFWEKVEDKGGLIRQKMRRLISWVAATRPFVALWERLGSKSYIEDRKYLISWHLLLFLSFFIGLSDGQKGGKPRV